MRVQILLLALLVTNCSLNYVTQPATTHQACCCRVVSAWLVLTSAMSTKYYLKTVAGFSNV